MFHSFKLSKAVALLVSVLLLAMIMLCSCSADSGSNKQSESQSTEAYSVDKYEYGDISVDSMDAVVGKECVGVTTEDDSDGVKIRYEYEGLTDNNIKAYGDYLLQSGFEEVQENVFSTTTPDGVAMEITIDGNEVSVRAK